MLICVPIPVYNDITGKESDETIAIVSVSFDFLLSIDECKETGNAILYYKNDTEVRTLVPFISLFVGVNNNTPITCLNMDKSKEISVAFNDMCKLNNL